MPDECERSSLKSSTLKTRCTAPREGPVFARSISLNHLVRRVPAWAWGRIVLRSGAQFSEIWGHGRPGEPGDRDEPPGSAAVFAGRHGDHFEATPVRSVRAPRAEISQIKAAIAEHCAFLAQLPNRGVMQITAMPRSR